MITSKVRYSWWQQVAALVLLLLITYLAAAIGSIGSLNAPQFYRELQLPGWAPPSWLFGPAWSLLYTLMAIAAWLVWRSGSLRNTASALQLYGVHLVVNALWSWLFFAWYQGGAALVNILILWLLIALMMRVFWRHSRLASAMLLPYLLWVSFASVLNWSIWQLNPALL